MQSYNITKNVNRKITSTEAGNVVTIVDNAVTEGENILSINTFIDNLKVYAFISSLDPIRLPNFKLEDSETDKLYKTLDVEFNSPRKQLDIVISDNGTDWNLIGSVSLLNPSGYPYRMYNLLDFFTDGLGARLGNNFKIGVRVKDVGYGVLTGDDMITVHGSYVQEYVVNTLTTTDETNKKISGFDSRQITIGYETEVLVESNDNRKYLLIQNDISFPNSSPVAIYFTGSTGANSITIEPGGNFSFGINEFYYLDTIYAGCLNENAQARIKYMEAF